MSERRATASAPVRNAEKESLKVSRFSRSHALLIAALATLAMALSVGAAGALAAPVVEIDSHHAPSSLQAGSEGHYSFVVRNVGDEPLVAPVTVTVELPDGVETRVRSRNFAAPASAFGTSGDWECPGSDTPGQSTVTCTFTQQFDPSTPAALPIGGRVPSALGVFVSVEPDASGPLTATARLEGGALTAVDSETAPLGPPPTSFGLAPGTLLADAFDEGGQQLRQAGAHPHRAFAAFDFNLRNGLEPDPFSEGGPLILAPSPVGTARNIDVRLPRGFVGNPLAVGRCPMSLFSQSNGNATACPPESQVGVIDYTIQSTQGGPGGAPDSGRAPLYNLLPPPGTLAAFGISIINRYIYIEARLDPSDYSVTTRTRNLNNTFPIHNQKVTLWGVPADPSHDADRWDPESSTYGTSFEGSARPFVSLPTECNVPDQTEFTGLTSWESSLNAGPYAAEPIAVGGCDRLEFKPEIVARPTTNLADSPSGLEFEMNIPQDEDPKGLATAHLRDAVVTLPAGMTVNPPSANGLGACSLAQVGISAAGVPNGDPVSCPDASKLGTVEAESPAIDHPVKGAVYLAEQGANPFGTLFALYLVLEDPETSVLVKLPGKVDPDPNTGQLTATFRNNPQLPVEDLRLKLFEGPHAALKTPSTCGTHTTDATFTPWSSPEAADAEKLSSFELTQGPGGGPCLNGGAAAPNGPAFDAGTMDPTAKAFSPFVLKLSRADGTQQLKAIDMALPKGLTAKLAGVPYCSDAALAAAAGKSGKAEQASSSCPAASRVGSVNVGAGAGSTPLYVGGQAYLAGPYKGAPLSLAIVTPAVAGPFDLGVVVVRTALQVNPETAQVRAVSDEIPQILQGIPLNIRSIALKMDRPEFMLNPTSCDPMSVDASALSVFGQSAPLSSRFQVGECNKLGFKPKLAIRFSGAPTRRGGHPKLSATLTMPPGGANIARAQVTMPKTEFLENAHIRTICTRVQYAAKACPQGSIYGYAKAWSPLLDQPLEGPVHLRSSSNKLPDLVASLDGQIHVDLVGRISSPNARIRNTFDLVPDAPVSKFVLTMQGGKKGLLVNSTNLCKAKPRASVSFEAQNGKAADSEPLVKVAGCGKKKRK